MQLHISSRSERNLRVTELSRLDFSEKILRHISRNTSRLLSTEGIGLPFLFKILFAIHKVTKTKPF